MRHFFLVIVCAALSSCATVDSNTQTRLPNNKQHDYNKYNLLDSPDGSKDPTAVVKIWGATY